MAIASTALITYADKLYGTSFTINYNGSLVVYQNATHTILHNINTNVGINFDLPSNLNRAVIPLFASASDKVAFLAKDGASNISQLYVKDLTTGVIQIASATTAGVVANQSTIYDFYLSADGRYASFTTIADNLAPNENYNLRDVFLKDLTSGTLTRVSQEASGVVGNGESSTSQVSPDGRFVNFVSSSRNFNSGDVPANEIYQKDMLSGEINLVNRANIPDYFFNGFSHKAMLGARNDSRTALEFASGADYLLMSGDGQKMAFSANGNYGDVSVYLRDQSTGVLVSVSTDNNGNALAGKNYLTGISQDGRYVTFISNTLTRQERNYDVYQKDLQSGSLQLITQNSAIAEHTVWTEFDVESSADGQSVVINTNKNLNPDNPNNPLIEHKITHYKLSNWVDNANAGVYLGSSGAEQLIGGNGDDQYFINNNGDFLEELPNAGTDVVYSFVENYILAENVENLIMAWNSNGTSATAFAKNANGNAASNIIVGNDAANIIQGLAGNDVFFGSAGNDVIAGGDGVDTVLYKGSILEYAVGNFNTYVQVTKSNAAGVDTLQGIERVQFSNAVISYPGDVSAGQAYRIYQAAFNRAPDSSGLGFWVKQIDNGASLESIAQGFMQSAEFQGMYGQNPSNGAMVEKFYQNVLHRSPDSGGLQYWNDLLNNQQATSAQVLASFSESPENQAALVGVLNAGFTFTPFG